VQWQLRRDLGNTKSTKPTQKAQRKILIQFCAFCVSFFALFVFLDCVIRLLQYHCETVAAKSGNAASGVVKKVGASATSRALPPKSKSSRRTPINFLLPYCYALLQGHTARPYCKALLQGSIVDDRLHGPFARAVPFPRGLSDDNCAELKKGQPLKLIPNF
jgi:hypothetical protein